MDYRILNVFTDYYDQLTDGQFVEGCIGVTDRQEIITLNACLALIYTINKIFKEDN